MFSISSILWPTDGSESSFRALEAAVEIAKKFNAALYAVQVVQQVPPLVVRSGVAPMAVKGFDVPLYQQELLKSAEDDLSRVVSEKIPQEIDTVSEIRIGKPAEIILEFSLEKNIDLIVMATQGRSVFSRFMIGSVAEKTIRQSTTPTLIIPAVSDDT